MKRIQVAILIIVFLSASFPVVAQTGKVMSDNEEKHFYSFIDSMRNAEFNFSHSKFLQIVDNIERFKPIVIPFEYKYLFENNSIGTSSDNSKCFMFRHKVADDNAEGRQGAYELYLYVSGDTIIDYYFTYPPYFKQETIEKAQLEIFKSLIKHENNYYSLQEYGNNLFRTGYKMPENYESVLKDYFVTKAGYFDIKEFDRFIFYEVIGERMRIWIELYVDKKDGTIKTFEASGFW